MSTPPISPTNMPQGSADSTAANAVATAPPDQQPAQAPQSRLGAILGAVAKVASVGLQGVPDKGRPSFVSGLGEGARAEQANINNQQAIKFKTFDDQVRMAQLHNQDLKMQQDTQAQQDAHTKAELDNRALANSLGIDYDTMPSHGQTVMDHLTAQTAANGAASVPPGTHLSGDGENINIPKDTQATRDGQKQMYGMLGPALGLPSLPPSAQFVPPNLMNMLTNKLHGYGVDGKPINHQDLPGAIGALQQQRDTLAQNGATPEQLKAVDNTLGIYKANLDALDSHAASVKAKGKQAELDVENSPANQAKAAAGAAQKAAAEQSAKSGGELNSVAFDPNFQNPDGSKGANVVMNKEDAQAKGLQHYKADPSQLNTVVAGMNDVQNKLNQLAAVTTDPQRMSQVNPGLAAAMLQHGKGIEIGAFDTHVDLSRVNEKLYAEDVQKANQATRDYVTALVGAHEAVTQLPRLQTFGKSSRMTQQQMEAAVNLLPHPGDGDMAAQKMTSLQGMLDPLRKQVPHMPGAEQIPSWLETKQAAAKQQQQPTPVGRFNPQSGLVDWLK